MLSRLNLVPLASDPSYDPSYRSLHKPVNAYIVNS
jgi:hypothetical protein